MKQQNAPLEHRSAQPEPRPVSQRRVSSSELLGKEGRLLIDHRGDCYVLRQTRNGKLILTK